jgi:hypothetical protein
LQANIGYDRSPRIGHTEDKLENTLLNIRLFPPPSSVWYTSKKLRDILIMYCSKVVSICHLICASLMYRGHAIPLAWRALRHRSIQVSFEDYQPVLNQVRAIMPSSMVIALFADRGFVHV